ncbi:glutamyl-tRNA reductase [Salinispirillum marinum]|uniref:Glutamyl-tRNA reductase n=2 Tax=Saccharospirillaceae TaxID=255527 RepID=A0ABV8BG23_9GAMM
MPLIALGINHKTAPVDVREKVAFAPENLAAAHQSLLAAGQGVSEAVIVSTCNRSELYCEVDDAAAGERLRQWLADYHQLPENALSAYSYEFHDLDVVNHLARVASGLDSLVLGEPQILGQLKSAYAVAQESATVSGQLNRLFQHCFGVAKSVRTNTAIGRNPVSVAYAAVDMSTHVFSDLGRCHALLIGAGETIELVARHLKERGIGKMTVANRTLQRAQQVSAEFGAHAILLGDIPDHLANADIVISSTASQLPILGKGAVERALKQRKHKPMFMVDIAVPRDIEPEVDALDDVYLYTVDDLQQVIEDNVRSRMAAAAEADSIITQAVQQYADSVRERDASATIKALREQVTTVADVELAKALARLARGDAPDDVMQQLSRSITNKVLHPPSVFLKEAGRQGRTDHIELIQEIYALPKDLSGGAETS